MREETTGGAYDIRQHAAAEVLELGEGLFDDLTAFAETHQAREGGDDAFPVDDVCAAADEFFRALRVLVGIDAHAAGGDRW